MPQQVAVGTLEESRVATQKQNKKLVTTIKKRLLLTSNTTLSFRGEV